MTEEEFERLLRSTWEEQVNQPTGVGYSPYATYEQFKSAAQASGLRDAAVVEKTLDSNQLQVALVQGIESGFGLLQATAEDEEVIQAVSTEPGTKTYNDFESGLERDFYLAELRREALANGVNLFDTDLDKVAEELGIDETLAALINTVGDDLFISQKYNTLFNAEDLQLIAEIVVERAQDPNVVEAMRNMNLEQFKLMIETGIPDIDLAVREVSQSRSDIVRKVAVGDGQFQQVYEEIFQRSMSTTGLDASLLNAVIAANVSAGGSPDSWQELAFVVSQQNIPFLGTSADDPQQTTVLRLDSDELARAILEAVEPYSTREELEANKGEIVAKIGEENYEFAATALRLKAESAQPDDGLTAQAAGAMAGRFLTRAQGRDPIVSQLQREIAPTLRDRYMRTNPDAPNHPLNMTGLNYRFRDKAINEIGRTAQEFQNNVRKYGGSYAGGEVLAIIAMSGFEDLAEQAWNQGSLDQQGQDRLKNWLNQDNTIADLNAAGFTNVYGNSYWATLLGSRDDGTGGGGSTAIAPAQEDIEDTYRALYQSYFFVDPTDADLAAFVATVESNVASYNATSGIQGNIFKDGGSQNDAIQRQLASTESQALRRLRETGLYDRLYGNRGNTTEAQWQMDFANAAANTGVPMGQSTDAIYAGMELGDTNVTKFMTTTSEAGMRSPNVRGNFAAVVKAMSRLT
jgi:hypothetical protein